MDKDLTIVLCICGIPIAIMVVCAIVGAVKPKPEPDKRPFFVSLRHQATGELQCFAAKDPTRPGYAGVLLPDGLYVDVDAVTGHADEAAKATVVAHVLRAGRGGAGKTELPTPEAVLPVLPSPFMLMGQTDDSEVEL